jgi:transcriptional regulator with XRE-family HTH domain
MIITPEQVRAARALLRLEQPELAQRARISLDTLRLVESEHGLSKVTLGVFDDVQHALEAAGAEFIERGVRRRTLTEQEQEVRVRDGLAVARRSGERLRDAPLFTEDDLYDENGLPA